MSVLSMKKRPVVAPGEMEEDGSDERAADVSFRGIFTDYSKK